MTPIEEAIQKAEDRKNFAQNGNKKNIYKELKGISDIGDTVYVQFVGVKGLDDLSGLNCHEVCRPWEKDGRSGMLVIPVPCTGKKDCPLCNSDKVYEYEGYKGSKKKVKVKKLEYLTPIWVVNLNKRWDADKEQFVGKKDENGDDVKPQLCYIRRGAGKRMIQSLVDFVRVEKDLTNKVIRIKAVPTKDGTIGFDYEYKVITNGISTVDLAQFGEIPDRFKYIIQPHTEEEIKRFLETGSFYEKKNKSGTTTTQAKETTEAKTPASEKGEFSGMPNVDVSNVESF